MHVWRVSLECHDWDNPFQTIFVVTEFHEIEQAVATARKNVPSGKISKVEYVGSAYVHTNTD